MRKLETYLCISFQRVSSSYSMSISMASRFFSTVVICPERGNSRESDTECAASVDMRTVR